MLFVDIVFWCRCWSLFKIMTSEIEKIWSRFGKACHGKMQENIKWLASSKIFSCLTRNPFGGVRRCKSHGVLLGPARPIYQRIYCDGCCVLRGHPVFIAQIWSRVGTPLGLTVNRVNKQSALATWECLKRLPKLPLALGAEKRTR